MTTQVLGQPIAARREAGREGLGTTAWIQFLRAGLDGVAAAALALAPFWWHLAFVEPDDPSDVTAVFATVGVYPSDVCLAVLALGGLVVLGLLARRRRAQARPWPLRLVALGVAALPVAALLSVLAASDAVLAAGLAGHLALLGLAWFAVGVAPVSARWLALGVVASGTIQAGLALGQFVSQRQLIPPELELPWLPGPDVTIGGTPVVLDPTGDRLLRAFGTFPHPNILGGYLAVALVLLPLLVSGRRGRWLAGPVGLLLGGGLLVSFSRAAWLAAAVGLGVWWLVASQRRIPWRWVVPGLALALIGLVLSPVGPLVGERLSPRPANDLERGSIEQRLALDRLALIEIKRHPSLGVGAGNFGLTTLEEGMQAVFGEPAHSVPLLVVAELGVPGALAGGMLVLGIAGLARRDPRATAPALAACGAVGVLMLLDHYLWSMALGRVIAWAPLAVLAATAARMAR